MERDLEEKTLGGIMASNEGEPDDGVSVEAPAEEEAAAAEDMTVDISSELGEFCPGITEEGAEAICNLDRYRELRALGLNSEEAYRATARQRATDNRAHLSGAVGNAAAPRRGGISEQELRSARELLGGISDAEIRRLYKRVNV